MLGVARVSEDGSHVYFVAEGQLTGANREGREPMAGAPNLYVYAAECPEGGDAAIRGTTCRLSGRSRRRPMRETGVRADNRPVQATPDGRFLVFQSAAT